MTIDDLAPSGRDIPITPARSAASVTLVVAWQNPESRLISPVGLLDQHAAAYRFRYLRAAQQVVGFEPFLSFPRWDDLYWSPRLFPLFSQRIMSPRRPDYIEYLHQLDLAADATPWEQLARSEGRRTGDTVQLFPVPSVSPEGRSRCLFLVHGVRHVLGDEPSPVDAGDELVLDDDPTNPVNPRAVLVSSTTGRHIGYVPDLLLGHLTVLREHGPVELRVEHANGPEAPPHLRVLVRLEGVAPPGYRPMNGAGWETFV